MLVYLITNIYFWLNAGNWKLVPGTFMILMKRQHKKTRQILVVDI